MSKKFKVFVTENENGIGKMSVAVTRADNEEAAEKEIRSKYENNGIDVMAIKAEEIV